MLFVEDIVAGYGKLEVLHGVSLEAKSSQITSIIGPNGSGKSTLIRTIFGLTDRKHGEIYFQDENITNFSTYEKLLKGIAVVPQGRRVFPRMSVEENLDVAGVILRDKGLVRERIQRALSLFPALKEKRKQLAGTLSGGEQTMLCISRALILDLKMLILDEPSLGLAPKVVNTTYEHIVQINKMGVGVIIVEQNVKKALKVSDRVYVLDLGRNRFNGSPAELTESLELSKLYLGGSRAG